MINIVLVEPEIPQNTGNIVRTGAATGSVVHLVRPLGFDTGDKMLKRAGLDYWKDCEIRYWDSFGELQEANPDGEFYYFSTKAKQSHCRPQYGKTYFWFSVRKRKACPKNLFTITIGTRYVFQWLRIRVLSICLIPWLLRYTKCCVSVISTV